MEFMFEQNGLIIDKATGERCIIVPSARLINVILRLYQIFQSGAKVITSESFKTAGK